VTAFDRPAARERFERDAEEWERRGHGLLAILERAGGSFLGRCGLKYWPQFDETEAGWILRRDAWGHGYASEAARACVEWGFSNFELAYLTAMIAPENVRSARVAARLGMTPFRDDLLLGDPVVVYKVDRPATLAP
jgi:RimJ/RimL family protein N-acetyltransferase